MNSGVIDRFTEVFTRYIDSGFGLLGGEVAFLASILILIDITLAGLFWAWGADENVLAHLVKKTMKGFRSHHHPPSLDFSWRNV
jgi:type IV secretion system protein TrbL